MRIGLISIAINNIVKISYFFIPFNSFLYILGYRINKGNNMLVVVSPAKKLDFKTHNSVESYSQCDFLGEAGKLAQKAKALSAQDLKNMMGISDALADLNVERFYDWQLPFDLSNARQACLAFNGDTYTGLEAPTLSAETLEYGQDHMRILSGLYGLLRPLDLMQAYRLEMGVKFQTERGETLYDFWGDILANGLNEAVADHKFPAIVNCASNEYFKSVKASALKVPVIETLFKEVKDGTAKIVSFSAKRARGMIARYMLENRIETVEQLKKFNTAGYVFMTQESTNTKLVFHRQK